jgi:hypothetical protein
MLIQSHRTHQSLGHLGAMSLHVSDKISSIARRQKTLPAGDVSDSTMDDSPLRSHRGEKHHAEIMHRSKTDRLLRRSHDARGSMTDEESGVGRRGFGRGERFKPRKETPVPERPIEHVPDPVRLLPKIRIVSQEDDDRLGKERSRMEAVVYAERSK